MTKSLNEKFPKRPSIDPSRRASYSNHMISPGEQLVDELNELRKQLTQLEIRLVNSTVERTAGLGETMGRDCGYYKKSLKQFIDRDYIDLKNRVALIHSLFERIG